MDQQYLQPKTLESALETLEHSTDSRAIIAGGTDLLLDIRQGRHAPPQLFLDVSEVEEMRGIRDEGEHIFLGGSVTHNEIVRSQLLGRHAQCVVEGCGLIGGPQVRNVATIGGNVAHALPAGDGTISLLALDAEVQIAGPTGARWEPLIDIFAGPGKVTFDRQKELLVGFRFAKKGPREASAFYRVMRPQGVAIAILNMAAWVKLDQDERLEDVRISCGPAGPRPFRAFRLEKYLQGKHLLDFVLEDACIILGEDVSLRTSAHRATKAYRHKLLPVLLRKVLKLAVHRIINVERE